MENVNVKYFDEHTKFPIIIEAQSQVEAPKEWAKDNVERISHMLNDTPAILFRGFPIETPQEFEQFVESIIPKLYGSYGDLPKKEGGKSIYKSTPYPNNMKILFHNESSHMKTWPRRQLFYCEIPSQVGGCTPIVDCRKVFNDLPEAVANAFEQKKLLYVRTFNEGLDVSWQHFFKTQSIEEVKERCQREGTQFSMFSDGVIQTKSLANAIAIDIETGEKSFFNQIQLHHPFWLESSLREMLVEMFGQERLTRNVFFGDGSVIPDEMLAEVDKAYRNNAVRFDWQKGDVLLLNNMLVAHARDEFEGERKIAVAMGEMVTY
ncbi:TauD/TfdA family dioxygenase [Pseudoalteromonas rhizosphaerae]|uniref:TauD/TfdA family dioxygenase n=1 Tax=Pseudoalteromonas rhizosphaerae TaxID=2518973 RepID=UPI00384E04E5